MRLADGTVMLFIISLTNLCGVAFAAAYCRSQRGVSSDQPQKNDGFGSFALGLAFLSQILYLVFGIAWFFRWLQFYPSNPTQNLTIFTGLALSAASFVSAFLGSGLKRYASIVSSAISGALWLLSAVASVAV